MSRSGGKLIAIALGLVYTGIYMLAQRVNFFFISFMFICGLISHQKFEIEVEIETSAQNPSNIGQYVRFFLQ